jgi:hypothetical protein
MIIENQPEARWSSSLCTSAANWISYIYPNIDSRLQPLYILIEVSLHLLLILFEMFFSRKWHRHRHTAQVYKTTRKHEQPGNFLRLRINPFTRFVVCVCVYKRACTDPYQTTIPTLFVPRKNEITECLFLFLTWNVVCYFRCDW